MDMVKISLINGLINRDDILILKSLRQLSDEVFLRNKWVIFKEALM